MNITTEDLVSLGFKENAESYTKKVGEYIFDVVFENDDCLYFNVNRGAYWIVLDKEFTSLEEFKEYIKKYEDFVPYDIVHTVTVKILDPDIYDIDNEIGDHLYALDEYLTDIAFYSFEVSIK